MIDLDQSEGEVIGKGYLQEDHERAIQGEQHFHRLGWKRLTIVLIVQSIALGSLSLPAAFATMGMVAGVILTVGLGVITIYASYIVGLVKLKYPHLPHYVDFGRLLMGGIGDKIFAVAFVALMTLTVGSHCLTGKLALATITESSVCALVFSIVSAIILFALAVPPSFAEISILGYIDFASIIVAIGIVMIATGIQSHDVSTTWSAWPKENLTFSEAFVAISNIAFAYAFSSAQPSFMDEMHTPKDFTKSITALALTQMTIYTITGALVYAFVGQDVQSPALLSASPLIAKVAFGVALPVIFISGSINATVASRFIHGRIYQDSTVRYINTAKGWMTWLGVVAFIIVLAWIVAEAIPFFSELLSICGCLLVSGFSFYLPPVMWFFLIKEGSWLEKRNIRLAILNLIVFVVGVTVLGCGMYASVTEVISKFRTGSINRPFSCNAG
ncbi:hypothetical protein BO94DRAFT_506089 [Aspergillus sclerotioniger CBS 115572]|uniref:Amino acid transporter transmembrane domain-containing protein n=1 Tax=Aspergillus sclerotioniger CBS 115572 TaxID=1450535 RepID=A0A317XEN8_9EURO|nr:hypothetical protein BO94DRAFT_506089 [Aspergillus sclerotioniger CBS 115572]PWY96671.1 hypothetical protein BO94DRAFT_506089 [Aspergillus sclerotioniger CBS 115572]